MKLYVQSKTIFDILTTKIEREAEITDFSEAMIRRIEELCIANKMNINQLATRAGINPSTIRSIMKKRCDSPKAETVHYICIGFGISLKEFYDSELFENIDDD